jgi:putative membrane protein
MTHYYWNDLYTGWGWFLWVGIWFLMISSFGNWGYSYRAHRKISDFRPTKGAIDILDERYARGEINHEEYARRKSAIIDGSMPVSQRSA